MKSKLILSQLLLPSAFLLASSTAHAASATWNVDAGGDWATPSNWNTGEVPGSTSATNNVDSANFGSLIPMTADRIVTVDTGRNIKFINFPATTKQYTLTGGSLVLSSGGTIRTTVGGSTHNPDTIASPITLANANAATSGTLLISAESTVDNRGLVVSGDITGAATAGASTLILGGTTVGNANIYYSKITGDIADGLGGGTLAVEKTGTGMWMLEGSKTFTGGLTVREGEVRIASNAAAAGSGPVTLGDDTPASTAAATLLVTNSLTVANALTVATGSSGTKTLTCGNVNPNYNGAITLNDPLTVAIGTSSGTNSYGFTLGGASGINLNANTLTLLLAPTTSSSTITNTITVNKAVSGTGGIAIVGTGASSNPGRVVNLNGTNSYTGGTTVGAANTDRPLIVNVSGDQSAAHGGWTIGNLGASTVNFLSGSTVALASGKNMTLSNGGSSDKALIVAGTVTTGSFGNLNVYGRSTLTLDSGANWTQNGGFIDIQPKNSSTNAVMNVNSGASFTYAGVNDINLARSTVSNSGSATLNLAGGTFTTGKGFSNSLAGSGSGTTDLNFSSGGTVRLSATIASLVIQGSTPFNVTTGTGGGVIDTNGFTTALDVGVSGGGGLTKASAGTLTMNVASTYTGATTVTGGTLALSGAGSIDDSASVTIAAGARLNTVAKIGTYAPANAQPITFGLNAASTGTSGQIDADSLDISTASISFDIANGPLDDAQYVLATYSGTLTGSFAAPAPAGYTYDYGTGTNSQIKLVAASGSPYDTWAGGPGLPIDGDANGDGVSNGLAFLLGAADKNENAINRLPTITQSGGNLVLDFDCLPVPARGGVTFKVEHSTNLAGWAATTNVVPDETNAVPDNNVTFEVHAGPVGPPALNSVQATIGSAAAGGSGKLFARLKAEKP